MGISKHIHIRLIIVMVCLCIGILPWYTGISIAREAEDRVNHSDRLNADELSLFVPGWVINSTLNQANLSTTKENIDRYNNLENNLNTPKKDTTEEDEGLNLKKKRGGNEKSGNQKANTTILTGDVAGDVKVGSGIDQRDADKKLISETGKKMVSEVIGGVRYVYAGFEELRQKRTPTIYGRQAKLHLPGRSPQINGLALFGIGLHMHPWRWVNGQLRQALDMGDGPIRRLASRARQDQGEGK